jgi:hypothetical protein
MRMLRANASLSGNSNQRPPTSRELNLMPPGSSTAQAGLFSPPATTDAPPLANPSTASTLLDPEALNAHVRRAATAALRDIQYQNEWPLPGQEAHKSTVPRDVTEFNFGKETPHKFVQRLKLQLQAARTKYEDWPVALLQGVTNHQVPGNWVSNRVTERSAVIAAFNRAPRPIFASPTQPPPQLTPDHFTHATNLFQEFIDKFSTEDLTRAAQKEFAALTRARGQSMQAYILILNEYAETLKKDLTNVDTKRNLIQEKLSKRMQDSLANARVGPATHTWEQICEHVTAVDALLTQDEITNEHAQPTTRTTQLTHEQGYQPQPRIRYGYNTHQQHERNTSERQTTRDHGPGSNRTSTAGKPAPTIRDATELAKRKNEACIHFAKFGNCRFGQRCDYMHIQNSNRESTHPPGHEHLSNTTEHGSTATGTKRMATRSQASTIDALEEQNKKTKTATE